jgi:hypothetical protein
MKRAAKALTAADLYEAEATECDAASKTKRAEAEAALTEALKLEARANFCRLLAGEMRRQETVQRKPLPIPLLRLVKKGITA